jgi:predicted O-methyltransferase YrrM
MTLARRAKALRSQCSGQSLAEALTSINQSRGFRSNQKQPEIVALLNAVKSLNPERVCEIGADGGGNLLLFSLVAAPNAHLISLDISYPFAQRWSYPRLAGYGQKLSCIRGNSHSRDAVEKVRRLLKGQPLDFLFIDGDHSRPGVEQDFEMYSPLVRNGGLIAFHDIVPDFRTRYGTPTASDVGEVPAFWMELKGRGGKTREFVQDPSQDGYGIGLLEWEGMDRKC